MLNKKIFGLFFLCFVFVTLQLYVAGETQSANPPPAASEETGQFWMGMSLQGKVLQIVDTASQIHLLVETGQGEMWLVVRKNSSENDDNQVLQLWMPTSQADAGTTQLCLSMPGLAMKPATAQALWRVIKASVFASGAPSEQGSYAVSLQHPSPSPSGKGLSFADALEAERNNKKVALPTQALGEESTGSAGAVVPSSGVRVDKASGANSYSVMECFNQARKLHGNTVRVRGKVVKFSPMIMGKNWVHIQDGTGDSTKNQHDLVVTTLANPAEGSVVTVEGVLSANRDFGAGYVYAAIIEDAKIEE